MPDIETDPATFHALRDYDNIAKQRVFDSMDANPDDGARALQLESATGVPAPLIHDDLDEFEKQHKAQLSGAILGLNQHLRDYVNSHPMAAMVSNDDWGPLDKLSSSIKAMGDDSIMKKAIEGWKKGFGEEPLGQMFTPEELEWARKNPFLGSILTMGMVGGELGMRGMSGAMTAAVYGIAEDLKQEAGISFDPERATQVLMDPGLAASLGPIGILDFPAETAAMLARTRVQMAFQKAKPYLDAGVEPPRNLDPLIDQAKAAETQKDAKNTHQAVQDAQATATGQRSPDLLEHFARLENKNTTQISGEAIRKLYGEKEPEPNDGILGWVPNINDQLRYAEETGGYVDVPTASWISRVTPEVEKALEDHIVHRPGGFSVEEAKEVRERAQEGLRAAPQAKAPTLPENTAEYRRENQYRTQVQDASGKEVGFIEWFDHDGQVEIRSPYIEEGSRNQGLGVAAYKKIADWAIANGKELISSSDLHAPAVHMYEALGRRGYKVIWPEDAERLPEGGMRLTGDRIRVVDGPTRAAPQAKGLSITSKVIKGMVDQFEKDPSSPRFLAFRHYLDSIIERGFEPSDADLEQFQRISDLAKAQPHFEAMKRSPSHQLYVMDRGVAGKPLYTSLGPEDEALWGEGFDRYSGNKGLLGAPREKGPLPINPVRDAAGLSRPEDEALASVERSITTPKDEKIAYLVPKSAWTTVEEKVVQAVDKVLSRILPDVGLSRFQPARRVALNRKEIRGVFSQFEHEMPIIVWAIDKNAEESIGTARHEAIHWLRRQGFFSEGEWDTLLNAALDENWIDKHNIQERYPDNTATEMLEEAIAEEFMEWGTKQDRLKHVANKIFEKLDEFLREVGDAIKATLGYSPKVEDLFQKIEKGEVGSRKGTTPLNPEAFRARLQVEDSLFKRAADVGMTEKQYKRYLSKIEKRRQADADKQLEVASRDIRKRQTKEWKANETKVRDEVTNDVTNRPISALDQLLREGKYAGGDWGSPIKINSARVPEALRDSLKDYISKDGVDPDILAKQFGFSSSEPMLNRLSMLREARKRLRMSPEDYAKKLINDETERRMKKQYGDLDENILREAQEHVVSHDQMELIHDEILGMGMKAFGTTLKNGDIVNGIPIGKAELTEWVKDRFDKLMAKGQTLEKFLDLAGKAGAGAQQVTREGKEPSAVDAFKALQQQGLNLYYAKEAKALDKMKGKLDKIIKRMQKREVPNLTPEYTNFIHQILQKVGKLPASIRTPVDIAEDIARRDHKDLVSFVQDKSEHHGLTLLFDNIIYDSDWKKSFDDLTVDELQSINQAVTSLYNMGRDERKVLRGGEKMDHDELVNKAVEQLALQGTKPIKQNPSKLKKGLGKLDQIFHMLIQMETIMNKMDLGDKFGLFNETVSYPGSAAANNYSALIKKYSRQLRELPSFTQKFLSEAVEPLFKRPSQPDTMIDMTKENVIGVLRNWGNPSNQDKLARGFTTEKSAIWNWLGRNSTKEMWDFVQAEGNVYARIYREAEQMIVEQGGTPPKKIELVPIQSPFKDAEGKPIVYRGWYHPIVWDRVEEGTSKTLHGFDPDGLRDSGYFRANTPKGYTYERTGYAGPIYLKMDLSAGRMSSMIRDVAFRPFVANTAKLFSDPKFRQAVLRHMGEPVRDMLNPYLRDVAGLGGFNSTAAAVVDRTIEFFRRNLIGQLIGWNIRTVEKHGISAAINSVGEVGIKPFATEMKLIIQELMAGKRDAWDFSSNSSEEIQRRHQSIIETAGGAYESLQGKQSFRNWMQEKGSAPIAFFDLISSKASWNAEYKSVMAELAQRFPDMSPEEYHGKAVSVADRAVRRAHGSTAITSRPQAMRGGAMARTFTSLYGFFNQMLQRMYEVSWRTREAGKAFSAGDKEAGRAMIGKAGMLLFTSAIMPGIVEEMVTPYTNGDRDSWAKWTAKTLALGLSATLPGVREFVHGNINGFGESLGMLDTGFQEAAKAWGDVIKGEKMFDREHIGKTVKDINALLGVATGKTNQEVGNLFKTMVDIIYHTPDTPKNAKQLWNEITVGKNKEPTDIIGRVIPGKLRKAK